MQFLRTIDDEARGQVTVQYVYVFNDAKQKSIRKQRSLLCFRQMHVMDGLIQHIVASPESKEAYIVVGNSVVRYTTWRQN